MQLRTTVVSLRAAALRHLCIAGLGILLTCPMGGCRQAVDPLPGASTESASSDGASDTTAASSPADAPLPTDETWDAVFIAGTQVGSVQTVTTPGQDGDASAVSIVSDTQLAIPRFGDVARMRVVTRSIETASGQVRSFLQRTEAGAFPIEVEGRVEPSRVVLITRTAGKERTSEFPWSVDHGGFFAVEASLRRSPMKPGEKRELSLLMPGLTGVQPATALLEAQQHEATTMLEGPRTLLKIKQELRAAGLTIQGFCWMDPQGEIVKASIADLQQETYRTTRDRALAPSTGGGFDLGFDTIVRVTSPLPRSWETTQVIYEATLPQRNPADTFASDLAQRVESLDPRRARITVCAIGPQHPREVPPQSPPTDDDRLPNSLIQSDDERICHLAGTIAADMTDPWQIAIALEKWVHEGIEKKNFSQGFAT
ncbi:MAG: hypothetical protein ACYC6N_32040, partial [Pirellulaceae bacterium]